LTLRCSVGSARSFYQHMEFDWFKDLKKCLPCRLPYYNIRESMETGRIPIKT
jgi:hypothetical protein